MNPQSRITPPISPCPTRAGFALIASLAIMAVLVMVAVALYSMSSVATRSAQIAKARTEAQANAKMALMMAVGELQKQMGPDQRITANAAIFDTDPATNEIDDIVHQHWIGVWDSWKAGGTTGSAHSTIQGVSDADIHPIYSNKKVNNRDGGYFRSWLVSLPGNGNTRYEAASNTGSGIQELSPSLRPQQGQNAVYLVHEGSLGDLSDSANLNDNDDRVAAGLIELKSDGNTSNATGRYAWWVSDESQKALIMDDAYRSDENENVLSTAEKLYRESAPGSTEVERAQGFGNFSNFGQLSKIATYKTIDSLDGLTPASSSTSVAETNFHHLTINSLGLLTDVREGGFKKDLNTLLEQPIDLNDTAVIQDHILYEFDDPRFDERTHSRVPIQDLSAYYQLYQDDPTFTEGRRGGLQFGSSIGVTAPDFGDERAGTEFEEKYLREYTALYRNPVPIRVQFVISVLAEPISDFDRITKPGDQGPNFPPESRDEPIRDSQTHKLVTTITPVVTLWNPNNVEMTLDQGSDITQALRMSSPAFYIEWTKNGSDLSAPVTTQSTTLLEMAAGHSSSNDDSYVAGMAFSETQEVKFAPGEVKIFSLPVSPTSPIYEREVYFDNVDAAEPGFDPNGFAPMISSAGAVEEDKDVYAFYDPDVIGFNRWTKKGTRIHMTFGRTDSISFGIYPEEDTKARNVSILSEVGGSAFNFWLINKAYTPWSSDNGSRFWKNYMFTTRAAGDLDEGNRLVNNQAAIPFNQDFMVLAFPQDQDSIPPDSEAILGSKIIDATNLAGFTVPLFQFTLTAACEVSGVGTGGFDNDTRRVTTRPFLHGSTIAAPFIDQLDPSSLYTYGWEWQVDSINDIKDAPIQDAGESSFYGGGYTSDLGTTRVVQRELPTLPPISIAALSHAHLGGFSLGNEPAVEYNNSARLGVKRVLRDITRSQGYQRVTAFGQAGLAPHTLQAIGNSYAHPKVPANQAFTTWERLFDLDTSRPNRMVWTDFDPPSWGGPKQVPVVDHSYLANKALWDEYFFSSISPQPGFIPFFSQSRTAEIVANQFFFGETPLPNRRFRPYTKNLDEDSLEALFESGSDPLAAGGLYETIAGHILVDGSFNVNSTSVEAWKVFLSSHRSNLVSYYEDGSSLSEYLPQDDETPVGFGSLPNEEPINESTLTDPGDPDQWLGWRTLSDEQIDQLAEAIVYQVKRRGPFLSLSEFINRRLDDDPANTDLALKGALQAALDFEGENEIPEVTVNKPFRSNQRSLDSEFDSMTGTERDTFEFAEALKGPIAYGSAPYVDQADFLRRFAGLLTPRGDTFKIRAYGDSLDASGNVIARVWCEATMQRTPEYVDASTDENYLPQADLLSDSNQKFGRSFEMIEFRWLSPDEV